MSTSHKNSSFAAVTLTLSIAALPNVVNGQPQSLTSVNSDKSSNSSTLKDSVKDTKTDVAQLIAAVLQKGTNENTGGNLSPVIGLPKAMPAMDVEVSISQKAAVTETRRCFVVYEGIAGDATKPNEKRPICAYFVRVKRSGLEKETRFFRFDVSGNLQKIVFLHGKYDESGKAIRGSGVTTEQDINSPEVKKTFEAEMKFWLKDWLKKQQNSPPKKTAESAKSNASGATL